MKMKVLITLLYLILSTPCVIDAVFLTKEMLQESLIGRQKSENYEKIQVSVLDQWAHGSTAASCGYHTLRNGMLIALSSLLPEGQFIEQLQSIEHMQERIAFPDGTWRSFIIQERVKLIGQKIICEKLMSHFHGALIKPAKQSDDCIRFNDGKLKLTFGKHHEGWKDIELERLSYVITNISREFDPELVEEGLRYHFTTADVYQKIAEYIKSSLKVLGSENALFIQLTAILEAGMPKLDTYFSPIDEDFIITWNRKLIDKGDKKKHKYTIARPLNGDWIEANEELPWLLALEKENGMLQNVAVDTAIYAGIQEPLAFGKTAEPMSAGEYKSYREDYIDVQLLEEFKAIKDKIRLGQDFVGLILVYLGGDACLEKPSDDSLKDCTESFTSELNNGHWIPLVIIAAEGRRQYVVCDSMGNGNRLDDVTVNKIIGILEGVKEKKKDKEKVASERILQGSSSVFSVPNKTPQTSDVIAHVKLNDKVKEIKEKVAEKANQKHLSSSGWSLFSLKGMFALSVTLLGSWIIYKTWFNKAKHDKQEKRLPQKKPDFIIGVGALEESQ